MKKTFLVLMLMLSWFAYSSTVEMDIVRILSRLSYQDAVDAKIMAIKSINGYSYYTIFYRAPRKINIDAN
jgi:hypothetical protein